MTEKKTTTKKSSVPSGKYKKGLGGRKESTAQVRIYPKQSGFIVNGKDMKEYFPRKVQQAAVLAPLKVTEMEKAVGVTVIVKGGGITGQAEAVRHGLAWALVDYDETLKTKLKKEGYMTRDSRHVERKKYGLRKARRRPQWSKR